MNDEKASVDVLRTKAEEFQLSTEGGIPIGVVLQEVMDDLLPSWSDVQTCPIHGEYRTLGHPHPCQWCEWDSQENLKALEARMLTEEPGR